MQDKVVLSKSVYETKNYGKFKVILGNRPVDKHHVRFLMRKMQTEGNRMPENPVEVNEHFEVIDGQHRVRAAEALGYPVYYVIHEGANLTDVLATNSGRKAWSWKDYAASWAYKGNQNYKDFQDLGNEFPVGFTILAYYANGGVSGNNSTKLFREGELEIPELAKSRELLTAYVDIRQTVGITNSPFAMALHRFMRYPTYDHNKMLEKLEGADLGRLYRCRTVGEYLFILEEIWRA